MEFLRNEDIELIFSHLDNKRHRLIVLLMLDCGLRVTEVLRLKWKDFDFRQKVVKVQSLKKREGTSKSKKNRTLPITKRLYDEIADYLKDTDIGDKNELVFKSPSIEGQAIGRSAVNKMLKRLENQLPELGASLNPHKFRHTSATILSTSGADLMQIQNYLGHDDPKTSMIYVHQDLDGIREIMDSKTVKKKTLRESLSSFLSKKKVELQDIAIFKPEIDFVIGRDQQLAEIQDFNSRKISVVITGDIGVGKTHLIEHTEVTGKIIEFDDTKSFKKSIADSILFLLNGDKDKARNLLFMGLEINQIQTKISRESLPNLCMMLCEITNFKEYTIKINDLDGLTESVEKALVILKEHFVILTATKELKVNRSSFVWGFERIHLEHLNRNETLKLFFRITDLKFESIEFVKNQVWQVSQGNCRAIVELSERFAKESDLSNENIEYLCENYIGRKVKEIDFSPILFLLFGSLVLLRYVSSEVGNPSLKVVGGFFFVIMMFGRYIFNFGKRSKL